jgi:hypothetical protein
VLDRLQITAALTSAHDMHRLSLNGGKKLMCVLKTLCCALALSALLTPVARADEHDKLTYFTFSGPVRLPGVTLPAGTYMFKLAESPSNRHIVQVFNKDGSKIYATILAIPDQRLDPTDKPIVMFRETPAGTPAAVRAWFYPGNTIGDEFVYPRQQAMQIARETHETVLSTSDTDMKSAEVTRVSENESAEQNRTVATTGTTPPPVQPEVSAPSSTSDNSTVAANTAARSARRTHLPRTASPLALYELVSGLALAGAFGIRKLRKTL